MPGYINELAVLFTLATALSVLARFFKQPLILAYLATGALVAYFGYVNVIGKETFELFANLGIMFLLFLVGLEINYTSLKLVGKTSVIIALGQILLTTIIGYSLASLLGFSQMSSLYIGIALTFSSTIIIIKLLSDKKDLNSLYGKISIGLLLIQDLVAILLLVVLNGIEGSGTFEWTSVVSTVLKAAGLFGLMLWLGRKILPHLFDEIAHSQELLFLTSTAWVLVVAAVVNLLGFSIEIAGFLAGIALANSSENFQIANRIRPLRDFFILIFFVVLGASFHLDNIAGLITPVAIFSLFVLIGNPLIVLIIMSLLGYRKRTSFLTGLTFAQISEFSLIMAALGLKVGHINSETVGVITAVGIVTITISSYLISNGNYLFRLLEKFLTFFEKRNSFDTTMPLAEKRAILLVGFHRTGQSLAHNLSSKEITVVDFDPEATKKLNQLGYHHVFGDISDTEIFEQVISPKTKLVVSTSPDLEDNLLLISRLKILKRRPGIVVRAETEKEALIFYEAGADYVLVPHFSSGHHLGKLLAAHATLSELKKLKQKDLKLIDHDLTD